MMWTDVFQILMMTAGSLAVLIHGFSTYGAAAIFDTAVQKGRANVTQMYVIQKLLFC